MRSRAAGLVLLGFAIAVHGGLALHTMSGNAATFDEGAHLSTGYRVLTLGDYRIDPLGLPAVKSLAALPLVHGAWLSALVLGVANGAVLARRLAVEEEDLEAGGHAAAGAEADDLRLQHGDGYTSFGQHMCRGKARKPRADHQRAAWFDPFH